MPQATFLSKSTFIRGVQCEKSLYLHKKRPFLRDRLSDEQLAKFSRGHKVGHLARGLFPGGADLTPPTHFQMAASIKHTAALISQGADVLYEAAFEYEGVRVALDILYRHEGQWKALEVKSSAAISETFIWDASLQYYVICGSGLPLSDFSIAYINPGYVRQGALDLEKLFIMESVADLVAGKQEEVHNYIERFREVVAMKSSPPIDIGPHCHSPYPCDFIGHCWKHIPKDVRNQMPALKPSGIQSLRENLGRGQAVLLSVLFYKPAIPPYDGVAPYQRLPYSMAWKALEREDADISFLHIEPGDALTADHVQRLFDAMKGYRRIVVFDSEPCHEAFEALSVYHTGMHDMLYQLSGRMHALTDPFLLPPESSPASPAFGHPSEVLRYFKLPEPFWNGPLNSNLEASQHYLKLAEEADASGDKVQMTDIELFQQDTLRQMQALYRHYLDA